MNIMVNGEPVDFKPQLSVQDLLAELGYDQTFVAVAINSECIQRGLFPNTTVAPGDEIEILSPMAGG